MVHQKNRGASIIEWLIASIVLAFIIGVIVAVPTMAVGNFWIGRDSLLTHMQADHSSITEIGILNRNIWSYSQVTVEQGGKQTVYLIDSNIMFRYEVHEFVLPGLGIAPEEAKP